MTTNLISKSSRRSLPPLRINFASVLTAILHLVQSGFGLVAVPEAVARRHIEQGLLRRVDTAIELEDLEFTATYFPSPGLSVNVAVAGMAKKWQDQARTNRDPRAGPEFKRHDDGGFRLAKCMGHKADHLGRSRAALNAERAG